MKKLALDDFLNYKFLSDLKLAGDGKSAAFISHQMNLNDDDYKSMIQIYKLTDDSLREIDSCNQVKNFAWRDEGYLAYVSYSNKREKTFKEEDPVFSKFYGLETNSGQSEELFTLPLAVSSFLFIDQNTIVLKATFDPVFDKYELLNDKEKEILAEKIKEGKNYQIVDEIPFWSDNLGFSNKKRQRLYRYRLKEKSLSPITDEFTDVLSYELNNSRDKLLLITNSFIDKKQISSQLEIYKCEEDKLTKISPYDNFTYTYADFLEDKIIFLGKDRKDYGLNENPVFYLTDLDGYNCKMISPEDFDFSACNTIASDCRYGSYKNYKVDNNFLYFVTTEGDSSFLNRIDKKGEIQKLSYKKGTIDCFDLVDEKILFVGLRSLRLQELYRLDGRSEVQLTNFNSWLIKERSLSIPEKLTFKSQEEVLIEGWLLKPTDFKLGQSYPAILNIHGGPKVAYGEVFFHEMQYWANNGYVVFFCNPRGSDGRGNAFADIRGKYGSIDYQDIMDFTDLVLEKYHFIDPERIGVTGGSYGGFMTNWIIGQTDRFRAAVSQRSVGNWTSKFFTTDIGYYFVEDQITANPWTDQEKLWQHSPLKYVDKVVTPTLFIHSQEDYRTCLVEAVQMFTGLKYQGVDSRLTIFKGENHDLSRAGRPKNRIKRLEEITSWFDKYLKL